MPRGMSRLKSAVISIWPWFVLYSVWRPQMASWAIGRLTFKMTQKHSKGQPDSHLHSYKSTYGPVDSWLRDHAGQGLSGHCLQRTLDFTEPTSHDMFGAFGPFVNTIPCLDDDTRESL